MSGANAAFALPPGDRDDAVAEEPKSWLDRNVGGTDAIAGRKPELSALTTIEQVMRDQANAIGALRMAIARGDDAALDNAAWRLAEACAPNLLMLAARLRNEIAAARRNPED